MPFIRLSHVERIIFLIVFLENCVAGKQAFMCIGYNVIIGMYFHFYINN